LAQFRLTSSQPTPVREPAGVTSIGSTIIGCHKMMHLAPAKRDGPAQVERLKEALIPSRPR
jgi:hypothetical protein